MFNASATDPDGDAIYYRWDFGDGKPQPTLNSVTARYTKGGTYSVNISAHDGRGGIDGKHFTLDVVDPLTNWTRRGETVTTSYLGDVIFAGGRFVAVGDGSVVLTSTDGLAWRSGMASASSFSLRGIAHNGARYVAVGFRPGTTNQGVVLHSEDAVAWTEAALPAGSGQLLGLTFGAGRFVTVGTQGRIYTSTDGASWSLAPSSITNVLRTVAYADGLFVVGGDGGRVLTSVDGTTWANRSLSTTGTSFGAARFNGLWHVSILVATTATTTITYTSPDGEEWTRVVGPLTGEQATFYHPISVGGVVFSPASNGSVAFAENERSFVTVPIDRTVGARFNGAAEGNGLLVIVGNNGLIYSAVLPTQFSAPIAAPALRLEGDSLKVSAGKKNILSASGAGFVKLELYANGTMVSEIPGSAGAFSWTPAATGRYSLVVRGVAASGESVVSETYPAQAALARWSWRNPSPVGADLTSAVRVDNKWWMVGRSGAFLTLDRDGTFGRVDFPTTQHLSGIAYANGRFTVSAAYRDLGALEDISPVWTSTDGYAWTPLLTGTGDNFNLNFVTHANGTWLGVGIAGANGVVLTSANGLTWARQVSGLTASIRGAAYGNGTWVAVAATGRIISSTDAIRWTERISGVTTDLNSVAFNNGVFVAAGASGVILRSTDGATWTRQSSAVTSLLNTVGVVAGSFVVGGDTGVTLHSSDGDTWARASMDGMTSSALFVASSGDNALLIGRAGEIFTGNTPFSWHRANTGTGETRRDIIHAGGRFVIVGSRTQAINSTLQVPVSVSTDGVNFIRANGTTALNAASLTSVTHAGTNYVAVGDGGRIFTSADALDWSAQTSGITTTLNTVIGGPAGFVAAGAGGAIVSSPDGVSWSVRPSGTTETINGAAYGAGHFVAVGNNGTLISSPDGTTWTAGASGVTPSLLTVGWFENIGFLAGGNNGTMISSPDGLNWQQVETGITSFINTIAQTPLGIVAASGTSGTMLISLDGVSWSTATNPSDRQMEGIAASPSTILLVGAAGTVLAFDFADTAPPPLIAVAPAPQRILPGGTAVFSVGAQNGFGAVYQWLKNGQPIPGANRPVYTINGANETNVGRYSVEITSATGTVVSPEAALEFATANEAGRLINLSLLTSLPVAGDSFTVGAVIGGAGTSGTKPLLVRAVGPGLGTFGITDALADPAIEFFAGTTRIGENDNWGGGAALRTAFASVGAFPFDPATSLDAAIFNASVAPGNNSVKVLGVGTASGAVLAELYDATPADAFTTATPRLINVSVLKHLGNGITAGFVIGGATPRRILVRAVGPTLGAAPFNVAGAAADPQLALYFGAAPIAANDDWGGTTALSATFSQLAAFALLPGSKDAALLAELQPGSYTVQVSGVAGSTGVVLIEIYEVP